MIRASGVPDFSAVEFEPKRSSFCLCIPVINEGERIRSELIRIHACEADKTTDVILCDGGSDDGSTDENFLKSYGVNTLLVKHGGGKLSAQLRMGYWWALQRGYAGIITVDGNNKDSVESLPLFIQKLREGYDLIQGSRYTRGGKSIRTPMARRLASTLIHAPLLSKAAGFRFTDTTNGFRGYSARYLRHPCVQPFRDVFITYELLAYLSVRATQIGLTACEVPVVREYPAGGKTPTKIRLLAGNFDLLRILIKTVRGDYNPGNQSAR
ncbi:MAG: glycosyltransferase family 2 protein [Clostridia bacterium]|nr:glycosyltransferase family 2 protein [Clostridia bacterium]